MTRLLKFPEYKALLVTVQNIQKYLLHVLVFSYIYMLNFSLKISIELLIVTTVTRHVLSQKNDFSKENTKLMMHTIM